MSSPYRDTPPSDPAEPMPDFGGPRTPTWRDVLAIIVMFLAPALLMLLQKDNDETLFAFVMFAPGLALSLLILFLERPVRRCFDRRYARIVAEGVAELEVEITSGDVSSPDPLRTVAR